MSGPKFELVEPVYIAMRNSLPPVPVRLEADQVDRAMKSYDTVLLASLPMAWAVVADDSKLILHVNKSRICLRIIESGVPELIEDLKFYSHTVFELLAQDIKAHLESSPDACMAIKKQEPSGIQTPTGSFRERLYQCIESAGIDLPALNAAIHGHTVH